jgi:hypothetical protein
MKALLKGCRFQSAEVKEATKVILHDVAGKDLQECLQQSYGP